MILHADLTKRAVVETRTASWVKSPERGVERIMLDRDGDEVARATSVVRYAPGSKFASHEHERGEEFLVLEGEFRDEVGAYPVGTYVRNPWHSHHAPFSVEGCILFVKLRQMLKNDLQRVCVESALARCVLGVGESEHEVVLHAFDTERVALVRWRAGFTSPEHAHADGEEILVLEGAFEDEHGVYAAGTWVRQPPGSTHRPSSHEGCLLYVKRGPG